MLKVLLKLTNSSEHCEMQGGSSEIIRKILTCLSLERDFVQNWSAGRVTEHDLVKSFRGILDQLMKLVPQLLILELRLCTYMEAWTNCGADFVPNLQAGMRMIAIKLLSQERRLTAPGALRTVLIVKERAEEALLLEGSGLT